MAELTVGYVAGMIAAAVFLGMNFWRKFPPRTGGRTTLSFTKPLWSFY